MRALILNGALPGDNELTPIEQSLDGALSIRGWAVDRFQLRDLTIVYCQGCFDCWLKTPGVCKVKDKAPQVTRALCQADLLVLLSPVTFGGYSSELKKALDRSIGIVSPFFTRIGGEVHHKPRYTRYPSLLGVGVVRDTDAEEERIFRALVTRNAINFHSPSHLAAIVRRDDEPEQMWRTVGRAVSEVLAANRGVA
jgi:multimeric flavodoxin WrbA